MLEAVVLDSVIIKPGAFTALPLSPADHTKFSSATAGHMVTAFLEFYHSLAFIAALPAFLLGLLEESVGFFISWAVSGLMPLAVATTADLRLATSALADFSAIFTMNVFRLDPLAASSRWAIYSVAGGVLGELLVPVLLEFQVKQFFNMF